MAARPTVGMRIAAWRAMRVAVVGATGNVGTSVLRALALDPGVEFIRGIARRLPRAVYAKTEFRAADVGVDPLEHLFEGMDAVVHLAWRIQSSHRPKELEQANVVGSQRVFNAAAAAGARALIYSSSIGAYSAGPKDQPVDESWPTRGIPTSLYSTQKAKVERIFDDFEARHPELRCVRLRPALIFKRDAATEIRRLFAAPWIPGALFDRHLLRVVPYHPRLCFQAVHSFDVGEAFRLALHADVRGAFNLASTPILNSAVFASAFKARLLPMSAGLLRGLASATWRLRLQHSDPGWVDLCLGSPLVDATRAAEVLGWIPKHGALDTLCELLDGIRDGAGIATPPLAPPGKVSANTRGSLSA